MQYILDGHTPCLCDDLSRWGSWMQSADRHVGRDEINGVKISTVFLGMDHRFASDGPGDPLLFETMVFGGSLDQEMDRYSTWDDAKAGHARMVARVRESESWPETVGV